MIAFKVIALLSIVMYMVRIYLSDEDIAYKAERYLLIIGCLCIGIGVGTLFGPVR